MRMIFNYLFPAILKWLTTYGSKIKYNIILYTNISITEIFIYCHLVPYYLLL